MVGDQGAFQGFLKEISFPQMKTIFIISLRHQLRFYT